MSTITFNTLNTAGRSEDTVFARALDVVGRASIAAVPFAAIAWMFVAH
jgi:hypothetical protein